VRDSTGFPQDMAFGATNNPDYAYLAGKITAEEAKALGVHWVLAPVADVNNNPDNPIVNIRSYGEDAGQVARFVAAFVRGCEENGVLATAKHFPGHGDTATDSHMTLPVISADRARLDAVELVPFRAAIAAGVSAVMPGHLALPAIEPEAQLPATLSSAVITGLLRRELGFDGLVISDALNMGAITNNFWVGEAAVRAVLAGTDVLLMPPEPRAVLAALKQAVHAGRLSQARLDASVERILRAKARLELHRQRTVNLDAVAHTVANQVSKETAQEIADRAVTLVRDETNLVPLDATQPRRALLIIVSGDPDPYPGETLQRELEWRVDRLEVIRTDTRFARSAEVTLPPAENFDCVIVAVFVQVADRKGTVALPAEQVALVEEVLGWQKPSVLVVLGSPYLVARFPQAKAVLCTFSTMEVTERAAIRALFGQVEIAGRLPVTVPGVAARGDGLSRARLPMELQPPPPEDTSRTPYDSALRSLALSW